MLMMLSVMLTAFMFSQTANAQDKKEMWPGVTIKVLTENDRVKIFEVTFAPGAVATWHDHPAHAIYAVTNVKMKEEVKDKPTVVNELKAGQAVWSEAVHHQTTNVGKTASTLIVTEIK